MSGIFLTRVVFLYFSFVLMKSDILETQHLVTNESGNYCFVDFAFPEGSVPEIEHYEMTYKKGETIFKQGTIVPHVAFLQTGMVKIMLESENRKQPLCIEKQGFIGLESMYMLMAIDWT